MTISDYFCADFKAAVADDAPILQLSATTRLLLGASTRTGYMLHRGCYVPVFFSDEMPAFTKGEGPDKRALSGQD